MRQTRDALVPGSAIRPTNVLASIGITPSLAINSLHIDPVEQPWAIHVARRQLITFPPLQPFQTLM